MATIAELREQYKGSAYDSMTDLQIAQHISQQNNEPLEVSAYDLGVELPKIRSNSGAAFKSGVAGYKQGFGNIAAAVGDATGLDSVKHYGENLRDDQGIIQNYVDSKNTDPTAFKDVHGLKDFGGYLRSGAIKSTPYLAEAITFAAADGITGGALTPAILEHYGALAAAKFGAKSIAESALRTGVTKEVAAQAAGRGLARTAMIPVVTAPSSLGDVLGNQYDEAGKYNLPTALPAAAAYTALNAFGLEGALARGLPVSLLKNRAGRAAAEFAKLGISGGVQETGQEVFNQVGRMGVNPEATLTSGNALERYKESFIMGGILEGSPGAFHGALTNPHAKNAEVKEKLDTRQPVDLIAPDTKPLLGLPNRPNDNMVVFPNGSTGTKEQVDSYIAALPEHQQVAARATLMGMNSDTLTKATDPTETPAPTLPATGKLTYNYIASLPEVGRIAPSTQMWIAKNAVNKTPQEFIDAVGPTDMSPARGKVFEAILAAHPDQNSVPSVTQSSPEPAAAAPIPNTEVATTPNAPALNLESISKVLSPQQNTIFNAMVDAVKNNEQDSIVSSDGTLQFQAIAARAGLPNRGAAQTAINRTIKKISTSTGVNVKEFLIQSNKATRNVEASDYDRQGLSPAVQPSLMDSTAIQAAYAEDGSSASMGIINSVGGSQSTKSGAGARGEEVSNEPSPPPSDNAVAAAVANRRAHYRDILANPDAPQARDDFNDYKADNAPEFDKYSFSDQAEYASDYFEILKDAKEKDLDSHQTGTLIEKLVRSFTREKEDNYGTLPNIPNDMVRLGERVGETENTGQVASDVSSSPKTTEPSGQSTSSAVETAAEPAKQDANSQQQTDTAARPENQASRVNDLASLVVTLKSLEKSPEHVAIAKSYIAEAMQGKDVETEAQAWADSVTRDATDKLDNEVNQANVQYRETSKYAKAGTVFLKNKRWIRRPATESQINAITPALETIKGYGWTRAIDKISSIQVISDPAFPADAGVEMQPDGTYVLFMHPNMYEGKNADGQEHDLMNSLQKTLDHELTHVADGINRYFSGEINDTFSNAVSELETLFKQNNIVRELFTYPINYKNNSDFDYRAEVLAELMSAYKDSTLVRILRDNAPSAYKYAEDVDNAIRQNKRSFESPSRESSIGRSERGSSNRVSGAGGNSSVSSTDAYAKRQVDAILEKLYGAQFKISEESRKFAGKIGGASGEIVYDGTTHALKKLGRSLLFLHDLVDEYKEKLPAIKDWYAAVQGSLSTRKQLEGDAEQIATDANNLKSGTAAINAFISKSTYEQKWGYDPKIAGKTIAVDPQMRIEFAKLSAEEQAVVKAVFVHSDKMNAAKKEILDALGIAPAFNSNAKLDGPYAPLKRFGNYVAVLKSTELRTAEKADDAKLVAKLKESPEHYVVSNFDSIGQAKQFAQANDVVNSGKFAMTDAFEKSARVGEARVMPSDVLQKVLSAVKMDENIPKPAFDAMNKLITDMYFQSLDEHNARTSGLRRLNRAGYDADMIRSFLSHARAEAGFLANMKFGGQINEHFYNMQNTAKDAESGKRVAQDEFNTIAEHYAENLKYVETPWQNRAMALTSAWQLATSLGYHITNAMQGIMVTIPKLGADFNNYSGAWDNLIKGYRVLKDTGVWGNIDLSKVKDVNLRTMLQKASDMGVLDVGMDEDLTHFEATKTGLHGVDNASAFARNALHRLRKVSRGVETANRVSSAVAGYNMSIQVGKSTEQATEYAIRILQTTQGDFSRIGAPLLLKKLPKIVTQYRKYQLMMAALYAKGYRDAFHGADAETRAIGRRMLAYKLFHTAVASGVLGLPLVNLVGMVFSALGGDDEPEDLERWLREAIGDKDTSDMLLHGPLSMLGLDMSSKLGDDKVFSIVPYGTIDFSSAKGVSQTAAGLAGPAFSELGHIADGVGYIGNGDYYKGIERFMPKGLESGMKAFRIANDGFTLKNGDVLFSPDSINGMALALDAIGMPSTEMKHMDWIRNQDYEITHFYKDKTTKLEEAYNKAYIAGDSEAMSETMTKWQDLQSGKDKLRPFFNNQQKALKRQPIATLLKYPQAQLKRDGELQRQNPEDSY